MKIFLSLVRCVLALALAYLQSRRDDAIKTATQEKIKSHKENIEAKKNAVKKVYSDARARLRGK